MPTEHGFEYEVRLAVSLPIAWTKYLKRVAAGHYDYKCREAGEAGVINGLHNTAHDGEFPSTYSVSWRDLDLIAKVMEQASYYDAGFLLINPINQWVRAAKDKITARHDEISGSIS